MSELRDIYQNMQAQQRKAAAGTAVISLPDYQPTGRGSKELQDIYGRLYNAKKADFEKNYAGIQERIIGAVQGAGNLYEDDVKAYNARRKQNEKTYVTDAQQWYDGAVQKRAAYDAKSKEALQLIEQYEPFLNAEWVRQARDGLSAMGRGYTAMSDNADMERQYWAQFPTQEEWLRYTDPERAQMLADAKSKWYENWFQKGAMEDGFSWSGLGKTIAGTWGDAAEDVWTGLVGMGEKALDALMTVLPYMEAGYYYANGGGYNLQNDAAFRQMNNSAKQLAEDFVKQDLYDEREVAKTFTSKPIEAITGIDTEQASILGDKADALAQSYGQLMGQLALSYAGVPWWVTSGATSLGAETENALHQGATMEQAAASGLVNAGAEILTEKLFGGSGLGEKGFINLDELTQGVSNKVVKTLLDYGVDLAAEGGEEVLSQVMSNLASKLYKEENLGQLLVSEEALQGYIESFIGGMALSGGMNVGKVADSIATRTDYRTGLTAEQQKVFDKAYSEALADARASGIELTDHYKRQVHDTLIEFIKNGSLAGAGQVQQAESAQSGDAAAAQDSTQLPQQTAQQAKPGTLEYVMELAQSGGLTNKQAQAVVEQPDLYQQVLELAGLESPATASGKRNAVKQAVAQIAESQTAESAVAQQGSQAARDGQILQTPTGTTQTQNSPQNFNAGALGGDIAFVNADKTKQPENVLQTAARYASAKVNQAVTKLVKKVKTGLFSANEKVSFGTVPDYIAAKIQSITGIDVSGYEVVIEARQIDHILKDHGTNGGTDQSMADDADIAKMEYVMDNPDSIVPAGRTRAYVTNKNGKMKPAVTVLFEKSLGEKSYYVVEAVPNTNKKTLYVVTAFIGEPGYKSEVPQDVGSGSPGATPKAEFAETTTVDQQSPDAISTNNVGSSNNSISQTDKNVNPDDSVGAAPAGFDPNSHLQYQYGTMPEHQNAVRPDDLPNRDASGNPISRVAGNIKGAKITPDAFVPLLDRMATGGELSYVSVTNDATTQKAMEDIMRYGWEGSLAAWQKGVREGKAGADMTATGALLLNNAAQAGDKALWCDILADMQLLGTNTAQGLQAFKIIKQLAPSDKLYMIRRSVEQLAKDSGYDLQIDEDLARQYQEAKTDAEADKILDKIAKDVAGQIKITWSEMWTAIRYLNMLGNFRTQIRNLSGNLTMGALNKVKNVVAVGIEAVANKVSGGKIQKTKSLTVNKEQLRSAMADYDTVADAISNGGRYNDPNAQRNAFMQKVQDNKQVFGFKPLEGYRKATSWAMEAGDVLFSKPAYARALAGYLKAKGITETDLSGIDPKIMDDARLYAVKEAQEVTFRDNNWLSTKLSQIGRGKDSNKWVKVVLDGILPFRKTPANVLIRAEQYSPLGLVNAVGNTVRAAKGDISANAAIESWAKGLTGTGVFFLGMLLYNCGLLNAGGDDDEKKAAFDRMNGVQPYSLNIGGNTYTIDWASPAAVPLLMGGEFMKAVGEDGFQLEDLTDALASIADPMIEMSMLQGVNDTLENIRYSDQPLAQILINAALSYLTQGLTNTAAGQIERSFEESRMQTYTDKNSDLPDWLQRALGKNSAKTPGWDYNQIPYINAWGEEEENMTPALGLVYNMLSPGYGDLKEDTPLTRELYRLDKAQGENVFPSAPNKSFTANGETVNMTAEQYVKAAKTKGQTQKRIVEELIGLKEYQALSDEDKAKAVRKAYEYAWDYTKQAVFDIEISTKWMRDIEGEEAEAILAWVQK